MTSIAAKILLLLLGLSVFIKADCISKDDNVSLHSSYSVKNNENKDAIDKFALFIKEIETDVKDSYKNIIGSQKKK